MLTYISACTSGYDKIQHCRSYQREVNSTFQTFIRISLNLVVKATICSAGNYTSDRCRFLELAMQGQEMMQRLKQMSTTYQLMSGLLRLLSATMTNLIICLVSYINASNILIFV